MGLFKKNKNEEIEEVVDKEVASKVEEASEETIEETSKETIEETSKEASDNKAADLSKQDEEDSEAVSAATEEASSESTNTEESTENAEASSDEEAADGELAKKEKKKAKKKKKKDDVNPEDINIVKELLSLIVYIGVVILLCFVIINYVGCRSKVDGNSMNKTLNDKDNLWVDKLSYTFGDPERFDIIIFNYDEDTTYVKRIIGLPGETVRIDQKGQIFINEQLLVENYGMEIILPNNLGRANQPVLLGKDEYFVLGDNRNNSSDSRWADVGNVSREDIVGKVVLRIYPFKDFGVVK